MSNPSRLDHPAHPGFARDQQPHLGTVLVMEIPEVAGEPAREVPLDDPRRQPLRHGLLEQVFFDGPMQLQLWWEGEDPLHKAAIELR